jgi:predicted unusual protein kinase regulating ubiquinone biosynthesis (AarF/ABC1/UbiB family)
MAKELDFINECNNSRRCFTELKHLGFVYVPEVKEEFTTQVIFEFKDFKKKLIK